MVPSCEVGIYLAGFPCKAFSSLRWVSEFLNDEAAKPFFGVKNNMEVARPIVTWPMFPQIYSLQIGILENVKGISGCLEEVLQLLKEALPDYAITYTTLCPLSGSLITEV